MIMSCEYSSDSYQSDTETENDTVSLSDASVNESGKDESNLETNTTSKNKPLSGDSTEIISEDGIIYVNKPRRDTSEDEIIYVDTPKLTDEERAELLKKILELLNK